MAQTGPNGVCEHKPLARVSTCGDPRVPPPSPHTPCTPRTNVSSQSTVSDQTPPTCYVRYDPDTDLDHTLSANERLNSHWNHSPSTHRHPNEDRWLPPIELAHRYYGRTKLSTFLSFLVSSTHRTKRRQRHNFNFTSNRWSGGLRWAILVLRSNMWSFVPSMHNAHHTSYSKSLSFPETQGKTHCDDLPRAIGVSIDQIIRT